MRKGILIILIALASISCALWNRHIASSPYQVQKYKEITLSNGLPVVLIRDNKLPKFGLSFIVGSGSSADLKNKNGLAYMTAAMLSKGTNKKSASRIAEDLEFYGSQFEPDISKDFTRINASSLSFYKKELMKTVSLILTQPNFSKKELERLRLKTQSGIKSLLDNPSSLALDFFKKQIYLQHPYGHNNAGSIDSLNKITSQDLKKFHEKYYNSNNMWLAVTGDFKDDIIEDLETYFGNKKIKHGNRNHIVDQYLKPAKNLKIYLIDKPSLNQAQIVIGHLGIRRRNKDYIKIRVANTILGSGFTSRLLSEIRVKQGLTYSIYSSFGSQKDLGTFYMSTFTRADKTHETITESIKVLKEFVNKGVNQKELDLAKAFLSGIFPKALETPQRLAGSLLYLRFHFLSDEYLSNYLENLKKIKLKEVNASIKKYFSPDNLTIVVYGPAKTILKELEKIAPVKIIHYSTLRL